MRKVLFFLLFLSCFLITGCQSYESVELLYSGSYQDHNDFDQVVEYIDTYEDYLAALYPIDLSDQFFNSHILYSVEMQINVTGFGLYSLDSYVVEDNVLTIYYVENLINVSDAESAYAMIFAISKNLYQRVNEIIIIEKPVEADIFLVYSGSNPSHGDNASIAQVTTNYESYLDSSYHLGLTNQFFDQYVLYKFAFLNNNIGENIYLFDDYEILEQTLLVYMIQNNDILTSPAFGGYVIFLGISKTIYESVVHIEIDLDNPMIHTPNIPTNYFDCPQCGEDDCHCQKVLFSLDAGTNWKIKDGELETFDTWKVESNKEIDDMVFFYASSYDQLLTAAENNQNVSFDEYDDLNETYWDALLDIYNESYFETHILIFYYKLESNISENYIYSVTVKDHTLTLNVNRFEGTATALSSWLHTITINKSDVAEVDHFNVVLRTVTPPQTSIIMSVKNQYLRDVYVNGLSTADFSGLHNLESVDVWTWGLSLDIHFNQTVTDLQLAEIIAVLSASDHIRSIGYTSNTWIRISVHNQFYDQYFAKTLTLTDLIGNSLPNSSAFGITFKDFIPIVLVTLKMKQHGRYYAERMAEQLAMLNFGFVDYHWYEFE